MMHREPLPAESGSLSPFSLFRHLNSSQRYFNQTPVSDETVCYRNQQQDLLVPSPDTATSLQCDESQTTIDSQSYTRLPASATATSGDVEKWKWLDPVPQSGFKGVSWNSRMKAWLAFYVTENGERKSKTFSTKKLGMEEARVQAITFCKQKQEQRKEAHKRKRTLKTNSLSTLTFIEQLSAAAQQKRNSQEILTNPSVFANQQMCSSYLQEKPSDTSLKCQSNLDDQIAYIPIVPISLDMIQETGLLQPLELTVLPPCQHCSQQPYPFLMIVSDESEQSSLWNGSNPLVTNRSGASLKQADKTKQFLG